MLDNNQVKRKEGRPVGTSYEKDPNKYVSNLKELTLQVCNKTQMKKVFQVALKQAQDGDKDSMNWLRDMMKLLFGADVDAVDAKDVGMNFNILNINKPKKIEQS